MQLSIPARATYMQYVGRWTSMHAAQHCYTSHIHASSGQMDKHACSSVFLREPHTCNKWEDGQACMQPSIATRATYMQEVGRWTSMQPAQHCYTSHIRAISGQMDKHACRSAVIHEPHIGGGQKSVDGAPCRGYHMFLWGPNV